MIKIPIYLMSPQCCITTENTVCFAAMKSDPQSSLNNNSGCSWALYILNHPLLLVRWFFHLHVVPSNYSLIIPYLVPGTRYQMCSTTPSFLDLPPIATQTRHKFISYLADMEIWLCWCKITKPPVPWYNGFASGGR